LDAAHKKAVADDQADDAAYEKTIASLRAELQQARNAQAAAVAKLAETESAWSARYAEMEAKASAPMAMAAAAGAGAVVSSTYSDAQYRRLQNRFDTMVERAQKDGYGDIERIEGIGPSFGQKLRAIGISWVRELLEQGASAAGRARIVEESGIKADLILRWVNAADLLRVEGVTPDWAELLEASGVDTVKELRTRVAANLQKKMEETNPTNGKGTYAREVPTVETVAGWIELAKKLDPKVTH
jgi:predicted flap endonuclease-1-like 5' DNA nuclease